MPEGHSLLVLNHQTPLQHTAPHSPAVFACVSQQTRATQTPNFGNNCCTFCRPSGFPPGDVPPAKSPFPPHFSRQRAELGRTSEEKQSFTLKRAQEKIQSANPKAIFGVQTPFTFSLLVKIPNFQHTTFQNFPPFSFYPQS